MQMPRRARTNLMVRMTLSLSLAFFWGLLVFCSSNEMDDHEICGNGADDNGNQLVDCDDPECMLEPACSSGGDADSDADVDSDADADADADADEDQDADREDASHDADVDGVDEADVDFSPVLCDFGSAEADYTRDYDAAPYCTTSGEEVLWSLLYWDAEEPDGATTTFCVRTAEEFSDLEVAPWVLLAETGGDESPADISHVLSTYGMPSNLRYLQLAYRGESAGGAPPVVTSLDLIFYCDCPCDDGRDCSDECECDPDC